jgi:hypothetical protein
VEDLGPTGALVLAERLSRTRPRRHRQDLVTSQAQEPASGTITAMTDLFDYIPHPHMKQRQTVGPPKVAASVAAVHGPGPLGRLNAKIGLKITLIVGTMWAAYLFAVIALLSGPSAFSTGNMVIIVQWVSGALLQLVLLPIIIVGQNVQATAADARSQATYDDASAVLEEAKQIQAHLQAQDLAIQQILTRLSAQDHGPSPA